MDTLESSAVGEELGRDRERDLPEVDLFALLLACPRSTGSEAHLDHLELVPRLDELVAEVVGQALDLERRQNGRIAVLTWQHGLQRDASPDAQLDELCASEEIVDRVKMMRCPAVRLAIAGSMSATMREAHL